MSEVHSPYGNQLYAELRRLSGFEVLGATLDYAAIQELKSADRTTAARLFAAGSPELARIIESGEPAEAAAYLIAVRDAARADGGVERTVFWGLLELLGSILGP